MQKITVEVCCGSADDVIEASRAGADRVELSSCLFYGGLTPSVGTVQTAKKTTGLEIMAMIRPREGGFMYTDAEYRCALSDARILLENGADGIVFGFLKADGTVDAERCRALLDIAGDKPTVFHRAIDVVPDWRNAIDTLCALGVRRILTSGQAPSVYDGLDTVAEMIRYARGRIEILPGAGITAKNIGEVVRVTGCTQVHLAHYKTCFDNSTRNNSAIFYGGALYPPEDRYPMLDSDRIAEMCANLPRQ